MIELLERICRDDPDRPAVVTHHESVTYGELLDASRRAAARLAADDVRRLAVVDHEASVVVPLLAGASAVGAEACLYPPVERDDVAALITRFGHDLVVSDRDDLSGLGARVVGTGDLLASHSDTAPAPPTTRPHMVLTTGTTGAPRGVLHDWSRLLRATTRIEPAPAGTEPERWLLAYGLHQFAGLQILLHVLAAGATLVAPAPRRPVEGLAAMRELGVTHASATPTYWRFLLAQLRSDGGPVPALRQITMGGEAVPPSVLDEVARTFEGARVSQVYAASEFGPTGSVRDGRSGLSTDVLHRDDDADVAMKVVDGELWIRSAGGMLGYHGEPPVDPDAWRATGDLVEVVGDRILFRGRTSEVINVGGVKVHPLPVEERVGAVDGVAVARVFGRPNAMVGAIVALEVVGAPGADHDTVKAAIRAACEDLPAAARPRSIQFVDDLATVGGKIIRSPR